MQTGMLSSALEHATPEQMFASQDPAEPKPVAISAVKALQKASAAGQRIYHLTQENMGSTLGSIHHDTDTILEIRSALLAGKEVITHTNAVSVPGWSGAGYIILDPDTGVGAYKIAGGSNGGVLVLVGMLLAFLIVAALFFISTPFLAVIAGIGGFLSHALITISLSGDPAASADYAIARLLTLVGSFVMLLILTGTVYMVLPWMFIATVLFGMIAAIASIIRHVYSVLSYNVKEPKSERYA